MTANNALGFPDQVCTELLMSAEEKRVLGRDVARVLKLLPIPGQPLGFFYWKDAAEQPVSGFFNPCERWEIAGPLIHKAQLEFAVHGERHVEARYPGGSWFPGETHLVAAMQCLKHDPRSSQTFVES